MTNREAYELGKATAGRDLIELAYGEDWFDEIHESRVLEAFFSAGRENEPAPVWVRAERYGAIPACGQSKNHADGHLEPGVSAARILTPGVSDYVWRMGGFGAFDREIVTIEGYYLHHRWGSDGEPVLVAARPAR